MNLHRIPGALALSLVGAVALAACGGDDEPSVTGSPDAGPGDTGNTADTGTMPDTGTIPDMGTPDMGTPDMGTPDMGTTGQGEGESCASLACADGLACVSFGDAFAVCLAVCQSDAECTGSALVPPSSTCANEGRLVAGDGTEFGWCVQEVAGEGDVVLDPPVPEELANGEILSACGEDTARLGLGDNRVRCVLTCEADTDCASSSLTPPAASCDSRGVCVQTVVEEGGTPVVSETQLEGCGSNFVALATGDGPNQLVCARSCADDPNACASSTLTPPASICSAGGICAQSVANEGEVATVTANEIQGCAEDLNRFAGDEPNQVECAKVCATAADCTTPGIAVCNLNGGSFTNPEITGICTRREGVHGEPCSSSHIVEGCTLDRDSQGTVFCTDFWGELDDDLALEGVCLNFCGNLDGDGSTPDDTCVTPFTRPGDPVPRCVTTNIDGNPILSAFPDVGVCSDNCDSFPNSCGGADPTSCWPLYPNFGIGFSQCLYPTGPELPVWYRALGTPTPDENCLERYNRCPADAHCELVSGTQAVCIYGCDPTAAPGATGCEGKTIDGQTDLRCTPVQTGSTDGICEPM